MFLRLLKKYDIPLATALMTTVAVGISVFLYLAIAGMFGRINKIGIATAIVIPLVIASLFSFFVLKVFKQLQQAETDLRNGEDRLRIILDSIPMGILIVDPWSYKIIDINDMAVETIGRSKEDIEGQICHGFIGQAEPDRRSGKDSGRDPESRDSIVRTWEGLEVPVLKTETSIELGGRKLILISFMDITQRKQAEVELQKVNEALQLLATLDGLTQIANRRRFDEHIFREWGRLKREQTPISIILCDIDFFKLYNDTYGHLLGDDCLRAVAQAIRRVIKRPGDLVARFGGEEFIVVLSNTNSKGALHVAEAIRLEVARLQIEHTASNLAPYVTLSLGVSSTTPSHHSSPSEFIDVVDQALYEAKNQGRNRVIFKPFHPQNGLSHQASEGEEENLNPKT